jgi:excinuclease UvrABC helicase subunit UvrB
MNKAELIAAIKEERGIVDEKGKKKATDVRDLKAKIKDLQDKRQKAVEDGRFKLADSFRRRISNLKKKTRRAA